MKKLSLLIPSIFLFILIISLSPQTYGQSYYNWLSNPSFNPSVNIIEDGGLESGAFNSGVLYGNWSQDIDAIITSDESNTGVYSLKFPSSSDWAWYNFTESYYTLGADISSATCYTMFDTSNDNLRVYAIYEDETSDLLNLPNGGSVGEWVQLDFTSVFDSAKRVKALHWYRNQVYPLYLDDVEIYVNDGSGQTEYNQYSSPWYYGGSYPSYSIIYHDDFGRDDDYSIQFGNWASKLIQDIDYFDAELIQYIACYAYSAVNVTEYSNIGVTVTLVYSDQTSDSTTEYLIIGDSNWELLNFGQAWINDNKFISKIYFEMVNPFPDAIQNFYIDDCALYSLVGQGASRFTWTTSPEPNDKTSTYAELYQGTTYTFYGTVYNSTGEPTQNGTVLITSSQGLQEANISLGLFNFTFSPRSYSGDKYENVGLLMTLDDPETLTVSIQIKWSYVGGGGITPSEVDADFISNFMIVGLLLFAPSVTIGYLGVQISPTLGIISFIGGLTLMGALCLQIGVISIWFMFAILIIDTIIVLGLLKTGRIG